MKVEDNSCTASLGFLLWNGRMMKDVHGFSAPQVPWGIDGEV